MGGIFSEAHELLTECMTELSEDEREPMMVWFAGHYAKALLGQRSFDRERKSGEEETISFSCDCSGWSKLPKDNDIVRLGRGSIDHAVRYLVNTVTYGPEGSIGAFECSRD